MGVTGVLIVLSQIASNFQSSKVVTQEIKDLKQEISRVSHDQQKYFVKKEEMKKVVLTLDRMNSKLNRIKEDIRLIDSKDFAKMGCTLEFPKTKNIITGMY